MHRTRWARGAFLLPLVIGSGACAPIFTGGDFASKHLAVKPVLTAQKPDIHLGRGEYETAVGAIMKRHYALALDHLTVARALDPGSVRVLNAFGVVYDKLGRFDLSKRYYAQAKAVAPQSRIVAWNMAYSKALQALSNGESIAMAMSALPPKPDLAASEPKTAEVPQTQSVAALSGVTHVAAAKNYAATSLPAQLMTPQINVRHTPQALEEATNAAKRVLVRSARQKAAAPVAADWQPPKRAELLAESGLTTKPVFRPGELVIDTPARFEASAVSSRGQESRTVAVAVPGLQRSGEVFDPIARHRAGAADDAASDTSRKISNRTLRYRLLTEHPLMIVNASSQRGVDLPVRTRLHRLGWTMARQREYAPHGQQYTTLFYPKPVASVARALKRTLTIPVRLIENACGCGGMRLVIGADALNGRLADAQRQNLMPGTRSLWPQNGGPEGG